MFDGQLMVCACELKDPKTLSTAKVKAQEIFPTVVDENLDISVIGKWLVKNDVMGWFLRQAANISFYAMNETFLPTNCNIKQIKSPTNGRAF